MSGANGRRGLRVGPERVSFTFDGRRFDGQQGDTASSALLAQGIRLMGRSVKARRLRGVMTAGTEEPNALMTVGTRPAVIPNVPATGLILKDGLTLRSQNRWPSLRFDVASLLQAGGGLFGAGFYYKTFMWPSWRTYESIIRALAGLGAAPGASNLPPVSVEHLSCDVLVAGGGPGGLMVARTAARAGARVVLCEREPVFGGELEFETGTIEGLPALAWVSATVAELVSRGARLLPDTAVVGGNGGQVIAHAEPGGLPGENAIYRIRPRFLVIATGAVERPYAFIDNDRPGVMLLGAAERYLLRYGVRVGADVVICANHNRAYLSAQRLQAGGVRVRAVIDPRPEQDVLQDSMVAQARSHLLTGGVRCLMGHVVVAAEGSPTVTGARISRCGSPDTAEVIACDAILVSGGWTPSSHASLQEGGALRYVEEIVAFVADQQPDLRMPVGAANGSLELSAVCAEALAAGERAVRAIGLTPAPRATPSAQGDPAPHLMALWRAPATRAAEKRQYVDFQNDVTVADLRVAVEEGFSDIEHAKRYTALGFGTDQGRLAGALGAAILAELRGEPLAQVGSSRLRPPFHPIAMQSLAGLRTREALRVARYTPLHHWHVANGAALEPSGLWMRPRYYRENGPDAATASLVEAGRVRTRGGVVDASTLGKIEIAGPDAAAFLDYVYMTQASALKVGRSRYAVNLREDGMVIDDGLLLRLASDRFRATTSTGHAEEMLSLFEHCLAAVRASDAVTLTDVTEAWSVIVAAGPTSREVLCRVLAPAWNDALAGMGHMQFTRGEYGRAELLVLRASFSGELAYELHCRPGVAVALWESLVAAGLKPYGLEALDILRVEKGYLTHSEISGQTTPDDLGMQALMREGSYLGSDLLDRPAFRESNRPRLVGLRAADGRAMFLAGAQIVTYAERNRPCGYVTSAAYSPALRQWIGLGLVARSVAEGTSVIARDPLREGDTVVRISAPVHFDPSGARMRA
jgi:methylglutamate dehydrogenase subunit C